MLNWFRGWWTDQRQRMTLGWRVYRRPQNYELALAVVAKLESPLMRAVKFSVMKVDRDSGLNRNTHRLRNEEGLEWAAHWCKEMGVDFQRNEAAMLLEILVAQNHGRLPR